MEHLPEPFGQPEGKLAFLLVILYNGGLVPIVDFLDPMDEAFELLQDPKLLLRTALGRIVLIRVRLILDFILVAVLEP